MGTLLVTLLLIPRPVLSGPEDTLATGDGAFLVHSTTSGMDAVIHPADPGAVKAGLETVYSHWVKALGMKAPLGDGMLGGDARIDVYLRRLDGPRGNTYPEEVGAGSAASAWIELDPRSSLASETRLSAAAGHEAHHAIQYAYSTTLARWIYEATATYVENTGFSGMQAETDMHDAGLLAHPEIPLDTVNGTHEYDEMAFVRFLTSSPPNRTTYDEGEMVALWSAMAESRDALLGIEQRQSEPMARVLWEFAHWMRRTVKGSPRLVGVGVVPSVIDVPLPPLSIAYVKLPVMGCDGVSVRLDGASDVAFDHFLTTGLTDFTDDGGTGGALEQPGEPLVLARGPSRQSSSVAITLSSLAAPDAFCRSGCACVGPAPPGCQCGIGSAGTDQVGGNARSAFAAFVISAFLLLLRRRRV